MPRAEPISSLPECGFTLRGQTCRTVGDHFCELRADHAQAFCEELCVHTKDEWARRPFILADWQRDNIVRPLFGEVRWSEEWQRYVRRFRLCWIEVARKNGKSELLAFIALYLLVADGVEGAEIYGCAKDREQASKVFDVAARMVQLSPVLSKRLIVKAHIKRIVDETTNSYYQVVAADASGNLGHNPHGVIFDEVLSQRDGRLWDAMRTGMGTRAQPLMVSATTAGDDPASFAKAEHEECLRIADDPARAPHRLVYIKHLPSDADPWNETLWPQPNPALGDFLSIEALREEALEAHNDPSKENSFRQYRLNQWVSQATRWMPMHLYAASSGDTWNSPEEGRARLARREAWCGFDLSAKLDMTAWCLVFPDGIGGVDVLWRFWVTEAATEYLAKHAEVPIIQWARDGWLTVTDGEVLDYERVYTDVGADAQLFKILGGDGDSWSMYPVIQELAKRTSLKADEDLVLYANTFERMTPGMVGLMGLVRQQRFRHHGNPVAVWHFDTVEVRRAVMNPDLMRPEKPQRDKDAKRIDAVPAACMAVAAWQTRGQIVKPRRKVRVMR